MLKFGAMLSRWMWHIQTTSKWYTAPTHSPALVLAPGLKVFEEWVELALWVALQVAVDGDVAPVADLLAQVHSVQDVLQEGRINRTAAAAAATTVRRREITIRHLQVLQHGTRQVAAVVGTAAH
jgi:hypothetical protein